MGLFQKVLIFSLSVRRAHSVLSDQALVWTLGFMFTVIKDPGVMERGDRGSSWRLSVLPPSFTGLRAGSGMVKVTCVGVQLRAAVSQVCASGQINKPPWASVSLMMRWMFHDCTGISGNMDEQDQKYLQRPSSEDVVALFPSRGV